MPVWDYTHKTRLTKLQSQVHAYEMRLLLKIEGVALFNKVHSSEIRKSLNIEPLLLRIERYQFTCFGHVSRMPQERLPKQALLVKVVLVKDQSDDLELDGPISSKI